MVSRRTSKRKARAKARAVCERKQTYQTRGKAKEAERAIRSKRGRFKPFGLHPYQCAACGLWHLGTGQP